MFTSNHYQWCYNVFCLGRPLKERMPTEYNLYRLFVTALCPQLQSVAFSFLAVLPIQQSQ